MGNKDSMPTFEFTCSTHTFQCELVGTTCNKCNRVVHIGCPMCPTHLRTCLHVKVAPSSIPQAGVGVFAWHPRKDAAVFQEGHFIIPYAGELIRKKELNRRYGKHTAPYGIQIRPNLFEDGACVRGVGSLVNHSVDKENVHYLRYRGRIYIVAKRDIHHGEELFANYGDTYSFQ